jgi:hypothetical protein
MAQPQTVSVFRGQRVDIPLRAQGRTPGQLKFLIRSRPTKGHLGEIRLTGPESAEVTYFHDDASTGTDSFTFAVQAVDSPVSAAASITMTITEEAPTLRVSPSVDFGVLEVGATDEKEIVLRNDGGGVLEGTMEVSIPWKIVGSAEYRLGRHQQGKVRLLFDPTEAQDYFGRLVFSHDARMPVELTASATSPFDFEPARKIELTSQDAGSVRSAGVVIRNRTARDRAVEITVPPEINAPEKVLVPAGQEEKVGLQTRPGFLGALEGRVSFESEGFSQRLPLRVLALHPILRIEPREGLDFGQVETRERRQGYLRIKNEGGSAARIRAKVPAEILLVPDPNTAVLQPGETRVFEVAFEAPSTGDYRSEIIIESGDGRPAAVPVVAQIGSPSAEAPNVPTATLNPADRPAENPPAARETPGSIPAIKEIRVLKAGERDYEVGWRKPASDPAAWIVQQRHLEANHPTDPPQVVWRDLNNVRFFTQGDLVGARFENLAPGQVWFLRVVSLDPQGRRSAPSPTFMISSAPAKDQTLLRAGLLLAAAGAGAIFFLKRRRRRRVEAMEQAEQIARIERR